MEQLLYVSEIVVNGLMTGVMYALVALGFVLIYKASGVFNYAQGAILLFAALTFVSLTDQGVPAVAAVALTIAALNGTAAGGALGMVLACDLRIAVPEARIFYPVMKLGFLPQPSDPARLVALAGPARAAMILMAGQKIGAETARDWGLLDRIVPPDALIGTAEELAADALGAAPAHVAGIKRMIRG